MNRRKAGNYYERKAAVYLETHGYKIVEKNYYTRYGEIDLIARDGIYLVFIEVKFRSSLKSGHPLEAVDEKKQSRIRKAALCYLYRKGYSEQTPCRFDVVWILRKERKEKIAVIQNAFE
jgi:putative endonuclease